MDNNKVVILGTAHGINTPGKCSPDKKFREYKFSREVINILKPKLEALGLTVYIDIPQDEVPAFYQIADFSAIIRERSRKNMAGFPTKMAESMATGRPVIASVFSDMTRFVEDGKNGILLNGCSVEAIADGLNRILALSSEQINSMKLSAKRCGETRFDYRNYIDSVNDFINKVS